jgi:hypothetical protein
VALRSAVSQVSVELTRNEKNTREWSVRFCPTEGRLWTGLIPIDLRAEEFPIPLCNSIFGVPTLPAERTTSFLAVKVYFVPVKFALVSSKNHEKIIARTTVILDKFNRAKCVGSCL